MKLDRNQLVDVIERAVFTYVQTVIGLVLATGLTDMNGLDHQDGGGRRSACGPVDRQGLHGIGASGRRRVSVGDRHQDRARRTPRRLT